MFYNANRCQYHQVMCNGLIFGYTTSVRSYAAPNPFVANSWIIELIENRLGEAQHPQ